MVADLQDVPNGYKRTEVGVIPNDWGVKKFDEVTALITCGMAATPKYVPLNDGFPFLSSTNVKNGKVRWKNYKYISKDLHKKLYRNNPPLAGDVLYSRVGSIGEAAVIQSNIEFSIYVSLTLIKMRDELNAEYCAHLLNSLTYRTLALETIYVGSGVGNLNVGVVRKFPIILPPFSEQKVIAKTLNDANEAIRSLEALIGKKRDVKQATLHALLTPTCRLPGFSGEWGELSLGKCASLKARIGWQGLTTKEYQEEGPCGLITGTDFKDGNIDWSNIVYVEKERYTQDINIQVKVDDVLITKDGTIGKVALVKSVPVPTTLNSGVFVIRPKAKAFHPKFLYYILLSEYFEIFLKKLSAGSTINHLYQKDFVDFQFPIPPSIKEQAAIAAILSDMDAEIEDLQARLDKLHDVKQGMMQVLLTGKVRLI